MSALPNWTGMDSADRDDLIRRYVSEGLSAAKIAQRFANATRSAVLGRVHRMGLSLDGRQAPAPKKSKPEPKKNPARLSAAKMAQRIENRAEAPGLFISTAAAFDPIPVAEPVAFALNTGCKWPVDGADGPGLLVCGDHKEPERAYCAHHSRLAYIPPTQRQRAVLKAAERAV